jgi:hypothetical protein
VMVEFGVVCVECGVIVVVGNELLERERKIRGNEKADWPITATME